MGLYASELAVATDAAVAAGALLRAELGRPGGPRGAGDKSPADEEAERLIRERLLGSFPTYGYLGEETGAAPVSDPDAHVWVVDPNDATAAFVRGERGSAVSIALLREGAPVVGVVYAFAAPDHAGDLIVAAQGEGSPRRNGRSAPRDTWPSALGSLDIVAAPRSVARWLERGGANLGTTRVQPVPSIAYRLALAAVGESAAAVGPRGPTSWDYAAAHAILRAGGGELWDADARPVSYERDGTGSVDACFACSEPVARALGQVDWAAALESRSEPVPVSYPLCVAERGRAIADPGLLARAQGCLLGQLAGDSLGALVEFSDAAQIAAQYPDGPRALVDGGYWTLLAGQPTDDSELALLLARSIVAQGRYDPEEAARAYAWWLASEPFDVGNTIGTALRAIGAEAAAARRRADAARAAASTTSQANGALMRLAPLAVYAHALSSDETAEVARLDAALTHPHPACADASAAFAIAVAFAVRTGAGATATYETALAWARDHGAHPLVVEALEAAPQGPPTQSPGTAGWVRIALHNAFHRLLRSRDAEEAIVETVRAGGDTDTNAAIAGALVGAVFGREAIPPAWRRLVLTCRPVAAAHARHVRPRALWPVDALLLAEHLLLAGAR